MPFDDFFEREWFGPADGRAEDQAPERYRKADLVPEEEVKASSKSPYTTIDPIG